VADGGEERGKENKAKGTKGGGGGARGEKEKKEKEGRRGKVKFAFLYYIFNQLRSPEEGDHPCGPANT